MVRAPSLTLRIPSTSLDERFTRVYGMSSSNNLETLISYAQFVGEGNGLSRDEAIYFAEAIKRGDRDALIAVVSASSRASLKEQLFLSSTAASLCAYIQKALEA